MAGSEGPTRAQMSARAYKKLVFHAAKYPAYTCVGVLVGTTDGHYDVQDLVPLAHHWATLSPMTEAGLALVPHLSASSRKMIGVYEIPERLEQKNVSPTTTALADKLAKKLGLSPLVLFVHGDKLLESPEKALLASARQTMRVSVPDSATLVPQLEKDVDSGKWAALADWDDHLENTTLDWLDNAPVA
ncbi:hypothetical protein MEQU1_000940 [Malassezia equina]|uniref:MPN domain-containing protein n=1 Tax=Malassezia equina TaxID=1381935 RepID=A0AAF0EC68_9BASI|nr:hypothetical protein MEQU1_000940 [Malassezia equina]